MLGELFDGWDALPSDDFISIEYTRTDVFIEKACEWLTLNIRMLLKVLDVEYNTYEIDVKDFIKDFRRAMEDEI